MWSTSCPRSVNSDLTNTEFLRRHARRLLRRAHADNTSTAMPVVRRLLAANVTRAGTLAELHKTRT
ncbi:MAG TPA: hypothetical protein VKJ77_01970, partial [Caballeronia sp.]|nr:hypothetical protein [Caballeronia sp.]